jgi:hypothetical protein
MHLQVCGGEEKGRKTPERSLVEPGRARHGEAMGVGTQRAHE